MRLRTYSVARILSWRFKSAALLSVACLPLSLLANGWRDTLLVAFAVAPVLSLIWLGDKLSAAAAGSLLTAPLYKDVVGRASMFIGWVLLAGLLGATTIAPLFQLIG